MPFLGDSAIRHMGAVLEEIEHHLYPLLATKTTAMPVVPEGARQSTLNINSIHGGEPEQQHLQVSGILVGRNGPKDVHGGSRPVDLFDAKADAEAANLSKTRFIAARFSSTYETPEGQRPLSSRTR